MGTTGRNRERTLVSLPDSTLAKLDAFRDREWAYIPKEQRAGNVAWNATILRLLQIEEDTRPEPVRHPTQRVRRGAA